MYHRKIKTGRLRVTAPARIVAALATVLIVAPHGTASAYGQLTHRRVVDHAYQVMRAVRYELAGGRLPHATTLGVDEAGAPVPLDSLLAVPATPPHAVVPFDGITQLEWDAFLQDVAANIDRLNRLESEVQPNICECSTDPDDDNFVSSEKDCSTPPEASNPEIKVLRSAFQSRPLGDVDVHLSQQHNREGACPVDLDKGVYRLPGMFESLPVAQGMAGDVLGYWSQDVDNSWNGDGHERNDRGPDSDVESNLSNSVGFWALVSGGVLALVPYLRDATNLLLGLVVGGVYCFFSLFWGGDSECYDEATQLVDQTNPVGIVDDGLDWVGDVLALGSPIDQHTAVGFWHLMPVNAANLDGDGAFDDVDGLRFRLGPYGAPDALQTAAIAVADLTGGTLDPGTSEGLRFQVDTEHTFQSDGMPDSVRRDRSDWRASSVAHTVFSPIDNLGHWGWSQWVWNGRRGAKHLGWPLHAIADAAEPHHTVGSFGFGHVPYENWVEEHEDRLLFRSPPCDRTTFVPFDPPRWSCPGGPDAGPDAGGDAGACVQAGFSRCSVPTAAEIDAQRAREYELTRWILGEAFMWRKRIKDLHATVTFEQAGALPIRQMVHELASKVAFRALELDSLGLGANSPFSATASALFHSGLEREGKSFFDSKDRAVLQRPLLVAAIGATLAALITIGENVPASADPPNAAPTVAITVPVSGNRLVGVGEDGTAVVSFHAEATDPEGDAITYRWTDTWSPEPNGSPSGNAKVIRDLSDPNHPVTTADQGPDQTVSLGFAAENCGAPEDHEIVVTATDSHGNTSSASAVIQVSSCVPD